MVVTDPVLSNPLRQRKLHCIKSIVTSIAKQQAFRGLATPINKRGRTIQRFVDWLLHSWRDETTINKRGTIERLFIVYFTSNCVPPWRVLQHSNNVILQAAAKLNAKLPARQQQQQQQQQQCSARIAREGQLLEEMVYQKRQRLDRKRWSTRRDGQKRQRLEPEETVDRKRRPKETETRTRGDSWLEAMAERRDDRMRQTEETTGKDGWPEDKFQICRLRRDTKGTQNKRWAVYEDKSRCDTSSTGPV